MNSFIKGHHRFFTRAAARVPLPVLALGAVTALLATPILADEWKADNLFSLNNGVSWTPPTVPSATEYGVWDASVTAANTVNSLGGDLMWGGIRILSPGGPVVLMSSNTLTLNGVSAIGIDMTVASQDLTLYCGLTLANAQTWNVGGGRTLNVLGPVGGSGALTKIGAGLLVLGGSSVTTGNAALADGVLLVDGSLA